MLLLIIASAAFGLGIGLYDFLLPFFLENLNMSYEIMGVIFSFSAILLFFVRIYAGHLSDIVGRKSVFSLSLLFCSVANLFTPFFPFIVPQIIFKSLRESSASIKETVQQLLVFDKWKKSFRIIMAWVAGFDSTFQGIGTIAGGILLAAFGYKFSFVCVGLIVLLVYVIFLIKFQEGNIHVKNQKFFGEINFSYLKTFPWASPFRHRLSFPLVLLNISGFLLGVGVSMSHTFIAPLFFYHKFSISPVVVAVIVAFHRIGLGLPMIVGGKIVKWNVKTTMIVAMLIQGFFTSIAIFPKYYVTAAILWLLHDILGASLWMPARSTLIQHYSREKSRGLDVGIVLAWQGLGWIFGPLIAGFVSKYSINYPFFLSGIIVACAVIPLFWLDYSVKERLLST
jgi:MFS family permease